MLCIVMHIANAIAIVIVIAIVIGNAHYAL